MRTLSHAGRYANLIHERAERYFCEHSTANQLHLVLGKMGYGAGGIQDYVQLIIYHGGSAEVVMRELGKPYLSTPRVSQSKNILVLVS